MSFKGWGRKCSLVIQASQINSSQNQFPIMLTEDTLPSEMFDADGSYPALSDGGDIRFTSDSTGHSRLPCEVEYFVTDNDPANGKAVIWVKVPTLNSVSNETIYIWYNKAGESQPGRGSTNGSECVWNGNYRLVMHMNQSPSGAASILDSTGNLNHFTSYNMDGTNLVDGKYGKCLRFNGTDEYAMISDNNSLDITPDLTVQGVFNSTDVTKNFGNIIAKSGANSLICINYRMAFWATDGTMCFDQKT